MNNCTNTMISYNQINKDDLFCYNKVNNKNGSIYICTKYNTFCMIIILPTFDCIVANRGFALIG